MRHAIIIDATSCDSINLAPDINLNPHRPHATADEHVLCGFDEIADGGCKAVSLPGNRAGVCLVRKDAIVYAYINSCPHTGAPLNWIGDQFLNREGDMIQCALHGALFRIADGLCIWGPCLHRRLTAVSTIIRDGGILLASQARFNRD